MASVETALYVLTEVVAAVEGGLPLQPAPPSPSFPHTFAKHAFIPY